MISKEVINRLYRQYPDRPATPDHLDVSLLFEYAIEHHDVEIDDNGNLLINSLPTNSPFHKIALKRVHAIVEFEDQIAIVLHSSIIFLNKHDSKAHVHIRPIKQSLLSKIFAPMDAEA